MKASKILLSTLVVLFAFTSCKKEDVETFKEQLEKLKSVNFPQVGEEVLNTKPTGRIETVGNQNKEEVVKTVKRQELLNPVHLMDFSYSDVMYPGSVLRGDSFLKGIYDPITIKNPKEVTISMTLQGKDLDVKKQTLPTLSNTRQAVNDLLKTNSANINFGQTSAYTEFISNSVSSSESLNKTLKIHTSLDVLKGLVKSKFNYDSQELSINGKKYVLVKIRQVFYNISVDNKSAEQWGDFENIGEYEPVYISSIDYGRAVHLLIETDKQANVISNTIYGELKTSYDAIGKFKAGVTYNKDLVKLFSENKIKIVILGGSVKGGLGINDCESLFKYLEAPSEEDIVSMAAPIGYKIRAIKDSREVGVTVPILSEEFGYK